MKVALDFDGVICERYGLPRPMDFRDCPPTENCEQAIKFLIKQGHDLYILTRRDKKDWKKMEDWMKANNLHKIRISNTKEADTAILIDDRAIRFTNWLDICKYFG
jgi:hypothetical protein